MKIKIYYKTCLVVKDYEQQYDVDFWATFFPTSHMIIFQMLIAFTVYYEWDIHYLNVVTIFLNADLDTEIYMKISDKIKEDVREFLIAKDIDSDNNYDMTVTLKL